MIFNSVNKMSEEKLAKINDNSCQSGITAIREKRILNAIMNTSIILMGTLMGGFGELFANVAGALASGMAEAVGGEKVGQEVRQEMEQKAPQVNEKMKSMMSDIRRDMLLQINEKREEIAPYLLDPMFEVGPKKIDEYDFGLPKLTEELDDDTLAKYTGLLVNQDANFAKLYSELTEWITTLPKPPEKS
jgi:hypothetical protein